MKVGGFIELVINWFVDHKESCGIAFISASGYMASVINSMGEIEPETFSEFKHMAWGLATTLGALILKLVFDKWIRPWFGLDKKTK